MNEYGVTTTFRIPAKAEVFLFASTSPSALGFTQRPIQWVLYKGPFRGVKLTTHLQLLIGAPREVARNG